MAGRGDRCGLSLMLSSEQARTQSQMRTTTFTANLQIQAVAVKRIGLFIQDLESLRIVYQSLPTKKIHGDTQKVGGQ